MPCRSLTRFPSPRTGHAVCTVSSSCTLVFGGMRTDAIAPTASSRAIDVWALETLTGATFSWRQLATDVALAPSGRWGHTCTLLTSQAHGSHGWTVLCFGGRDSTSIYGDVWLLSGKIDSRSHKVSAIPSDNSRGASPCPRCFHSAVAHYGCVVVFGGLTGAVEEVAAVTAAAVTVAGGGSRGWLTQRQQNDQRVLALNDCFLYDPAHGWLEVEPSGVPPSPRACHSAVVLELQRQGGSSVMAVFGGVNAVGKDLQCSDCIMHLLVLDGAPEDWIWSSPCVTGSPPAGVSAPRFDWPAVLAAVAMAGALRSDKSCACVLILGGRSGRLPAPAEGDGGGTAGELDAELFQADNGCVLTVDASFDGTGVAAAEQRVGGRAQTVGGAFTWHSPASSVLTCSPQPALGWDVVGNTVPPLRSGPGLAWLKSSACCGPYESTCTNEAGEGNTSAPLSLYVILGCPLTPIDTDSRFVWRLSLAAPLPWTCERLLWIGLLQNTDNDICWLRRLSVEAVRHIVQLYNDSAVTPPSDCS